MTVPPETEKAAGANQADLPEQTSPATETFNKNERNREDCQEKQRGRENADLAAIDALFPDLLDEMMQMGVRPVYGASPIKRARSTREQVEALKAALLDIVIRQKPMTVRQVFYQATVHHLVDKSEAGYKQVQRLLADMRKARQMPFSWIADNTRMVWRTTSFDTPADAVAATASFYRKALWSDAEDRIEIWLEKDALSGVISPITHEYDVGLYVARGFASLSFLSTSAETIAAAGKPTTIYHLGDFDPSGVMAGQKIEDTLRNMAPEADLEFRRLAVTRQQIEAWNLPSRPTKQSTHARGWEGDSVELDAIPPDLLRNLVRTAIERHLPAEQFAILKEAEKSERALLWSWADTAAQEASA